MKRIINFFILIALMGTPVLAQAIMTPVERKVLVNLGDNGIVLNGYDPVAYFTKGQAVKGFANFQTRVGNAVYLFESLEHKTVFDANPHKYKPQFGGYDATAMIHGQLQAGDPTQFAIVQGTLLIHQDEQAKRAFLENPNGNFSEAWKQWFIVLQRLGN